MVNSIFSVLIEKIIGFISITCIFYNRGEVKFALIFIIVKVFICNILVKGKRVFCMDKIKVIINNKQKEVKVPTGLRMIVRRCCNAVLRTEEFDSSAEVSVTFVNNEQIKELNNKYRQKNVPTDVLSFPMGKDGVYDEDPATGAKILGDVIISLEKAQEQAQKYGNTLQKEISHLTVHGVLHLLGYVHENGGIEKVKMRDKEELIMAKMGFVGGVSYYYNK